MDVPVLFNSYTTEEDKLGGEIRTNVSLGTKMCQMIWRTLKESDEAGKHMPSGMAWLKTWRESALLTTELSVTINGKEFDVIGYEDHDRMYVYLKIQWHES